MNLTEEQENQINDLWVKRFNKLFNISPVIFEEIIKEGIALATKPKKWIKSTEETPEPYLDIYMNLLGDGVVQYGYSVNNGFSRVFYIDIKTGEKYEPNPELYWQYVDLPNPVEKENV